LSRWFWAASTGIEVALKSVDRAQDRSGQDAGLIGDRFQIGAFLFGGFGGDLGLALQPVLAGGGFSGGQSRDGGIGGDGDQGGFGWAPALGFVAQLDIVDEFQLFEGDGDPIGHGGQVATIDGGVAILGQFQVLVERGAGVGDIDGGAAGAEFGEAHPHDFEVLAQFGLKVGDGAGAVATRSDFDFLALEMLFFDRADGQGRVIGFIERAIGRSQIPLLRSLNKTPQARKDSHSN
jgi:hypothetical protein